MKPTNTMQLEAFITSQELVIDLYTVKENQLHNIEGLIRAEIDSSLDLIRDEIGDFEKAYMFLSGLYDLYRAWEQLEEVREWIKGTTPIQIWASRADNNWLDEPVELIRLPIKNVNLDQLVVVHIRHRSDHPQYKEHMRGRGAFFYQLLPDGEKYEAIHFDGNTLFVYDPDSEERGVTLPEPLDLVRDYGIWVGHCLRQEGWEDVGVFPYVYAHEAADHSDATRDAIEAFLRQFYEPKVVEMHMDDIYGDKYGL